jgi:hypothetical protein
VQTKKAGVPMVLRDEVSLAKLWVRASFKVDFTEEECVWLDGMGVEIPDWSEEENEDCG